MKTVVITTFAFLVTAYAMAGDSPVELRLDAPKHTKAPSGSATAGSTWVTFPVRVTNTSARPVWFWGYSPGSPFYSLFTRKSDSGAWADRGIGFCGTGGGTHQLAPSATTTFSVSVPVRYIGQQLRVEMSVLDSPRDSKRIIVRSASTPIK